MPVSLMDCVLGLDTGAARRRRSPSPLPPDKPVYIRATKTHTKGGKPAKSYRLSRSVRIGDKVRQETLLNLGVDYPVPKQQWRDVILVTEVLLHGRQPMLPVPADIQAAAEDLVRRLRAQGLGPQEPAQTGRGRAMATVDLDTLEHEEPRSVGGERVCLAGWRSWAFGPCWTAGAGADGSGSGDGDGGPRYAGT